MVKPNLESCRLARLNELGSLIDECIYAKDEKMLIELASECSKKAETSTSVDRVSLFLFEANIRKALFHITNPSEENQNQWSWDQPEKTEELLLLRKALLEQGLTDAPLEIELKIRTNIAGILSSLGRSIEAFEHWNIVLEIVPNFAMALGNRAIAYQFICKNLYDGGHQSIYLKAAEWGFKDALKPHAYWDSGFDENAADHFAEQLSKLPHYHSDKKIKDLIHPRKWDLGSSVEEINFNQWCLENCLFINPLNDLNIGSISAKDVFHLPNHSYLISEPPRFVQYYDLLKQEYVSARALYFEAVLGDAGDYAYNNNLQFESFDGSLYGLKYDKLKLAFRSLYSIFDKLAVFINDYFALGKKITKVSFRSIWYKDDLKTLNPKFTEGENWAMKSLNSLSQDLYEENFNNVAQPDAKHLDKLRNAVEHRFLSIHEYMVMEESSESQFRIGLEDFENKTMRIMKLSRAALMYLSFAVRLEELHRAKSKPTDEIIPLIHGLPKIT